MGLKKSTLWAGLCLHKHGRKVYTQCYLGPTFLFRSVSEQIFAQINAYTCVQCQIIYPREQLFTIFELETMGFAESEVSEHSLYLRNIAVWVMDLKSKYHCTLTSNTSTRIRDLHFVSLFTPRKSKGLSGRSLRKLPFLAHALFVKVNIYSCTKENDEKHGVLFFKCGLFACRQWQWLLHSFWRLWTEPLIHKKKKKLTWSAVFELPAGSWRLRNDCSSVHVLFVHSLENHK